MNACLIPVFNRPEFLTLALENILKAEGAAEVHYIFRLDHGFDRGNLHVIAGFPFAHEITYTPRVHYKLAKQSHSLLTGLILAAQRTDNLVYLIEDDVMIGRDFFRWHNGVHQAHPDLFSSHGNLNINRTIPTEGNWDEYYLTTFDYGSIGTCMHRDTILGDIAPHATPAYYRSPINYVLSTFKGCPLHRDQAEQDGLIRRIQWKSGRPQAYPHTQQIDGLLYGPRCFHAGFYGKNRPKRYLGDTDQKIARLREIIYSDEGMRRFAMLPGYYVDSRPCALELPEWTELRLKEPFPAPLPV